MSPRSEARAHGTALPPGALAPGSPAVAPSPTMPKGYFLELPISSDSLTLASCFLTESATSVQLVSSFLFSGAQTAHLGEEGSQGVGVEGVVHGLHPILSLWPGRS